MMPNNHKINTAMAFLIFCAVLCGQNEAAAQVAKELNKIDQQNYVVTGNDMRCYQVLYESTDHSEYATYYQLIREKIKDKLKKNYRYGYKKGEVNISFILNHDGSLIKLDVNSDNSTKNEELVDVAVLSVKQASPFPRFPETLPLLKMSFNIKITFKDN